MIAALIGGLFVIFDSIYTTERTIRSTERAEARLTEEARAGSQEASATPPPAATTAELLPESPPPPVTGTSAAPAAVAPLLDNIDDDCLDRRWWAPIPRAEPRESSSIYTASCVSMETAAHIFEWGGALLFAPPTAWEEGITLVARPAECRYREVEVLVTGFNLNGSGWLGLIADYPQVGGEVISLWLGRFVGTSGPIQAVSTSGHTPALTASDRRMLLDDVDPGDSAVLSVRFDGTTATTGIAVASQTAEVQEIAGGFPLNFSVVYAAGESDEMSILLVSVNVEWEPPWCGLR